MNKIIPYRQELRAYARELRNNSTFPEILLWQQIKSKKLGVGFKRQVPMLDFIVDFYCPEILLAIEVDGGYHQHQYIEDCQRQQQIEAYGICFLRFTNEEIKSDMANVLLKIENKINELKETLFSKEERQTTPADGEPPQADNQTYPADAEPPLRNNQTSQADTPTYRADN